MNRASARDTAKSCDMGDSEIRGTLFWGPYNKDPTIYLRYKIRVPYFRKPPYYCEPQALGPKPWALNYPKPKALKP